MKLIDLIELLFRPLPVQFEPVPWRGPMPDRWLHADWRDRVWVDSHGWERPARQPVYRFKYSDRFVETGSAARVVRPVTGPTIADLIRDGYLAPLSSNWPKS